MYRPLPSKIARFVTSAHRRACRTLEGSRYLVARNGGSAQKCRWISKSVCQSLRRSPAGAASPQSTARSWRNRSVLPRRRASAMPRSTRCSHGVCGWKQSPSWLWMPSSSRRSSPRMARPFSSLDSSFHLFSVQPSLSRISNSSFKSLKNRLLLISASALRRQADLRLRGSSEDLRLAAAKRPVLAPHIHTPRNCPSPSATKRSLR
mmetsp:Transcript_108896/g.283991  ORF Transcript_108896/g.283991 Transcript_108896/m.283991 type:complete len:206 (+) Transcript_108896:56-673(+)